MPRTKRPVRQQEKSVEEDNDLRKFNNIVIDKKNKIDSRVQMECRNIEVAFKILLGSIPKNNLNKTLGQLKTELVLKDTDSSHRTRNSSRPASHDDGYNTESSQGSGDRGTKKTFMAPPTVGRSTGRRSRSADASARMLPPVTASKTVQRRRSKSVYKTPAYSKNSALKYPAITPKVTPQTPLTVLRQPRQGEMVVSMSGSPVMVPSCYTMQQNEKANCNILLQDGTMLSLQPKHMRQSQAFIPFSLMDSNVISQLKTLKDNLATVVKLGEKAMIK